MTIQFKSLLKAEPPNFAILNDDILLRDELKQIFLLKIFYKK